MGDQGPRYAVYFVPAAESALYRFGAAVLQYDGYTGKSVQPLPEMRGRINEWQSATEEPRRYGFHATLKAPFHLLPSCTEAQFVNAFQSFAALGRRAATITPVLRVLSGFVAVAADRPSPLVDALASDCTTIFDAFRAPMSPQERARRVAAGLNQGQIQNLDRWGYPYLFADFRFHMTLTGRLETDRRKDMQATLEMVFQRMCGQASVPIDRLALARQDSPSAAFRLLSHAALRGV